MALRRGVGAGQRAQCSRRRLSARSWPAERQGLPHLAPAPASLQALWVMKGGELDLHGKLYSPTWTRLAQVPRPCGPRCARDVRRWRCCPSPLAPPAPPCPPPQTANGGASTLQLQDPVSSWEAGQQVVLTTTIWKDEQVRGGVQGASWEGGAAAGGDAPVPSPCMLAPQRRDEALRSPAPTCLPRRCRAGEPE